MKYAICIKYFNDDDLEITIKEGTVVEVKEDRWNTVEYLQIKDPDTKRCIRFVKNGSFDLFHENFSDHFEDYTRKIKIDNYLEKC